MSTEEAIQAAGADVAPRITPADIEAAIASEHYFTAAQGALAAQVDYEDPPAPLHLLTLCVLVLRNGFTVVGKSACASPENFNADIGKRWARDDAMRQVWPLLGYQLRERLHAQAIAAAAASACGLLPHQARVIEEQASRDAELRRLRAFLASPVAQSIDDAEKARLFKQATIMTALVDVLAERIAAFPGAAA